MAMFITLISLLLLDSYTLLSPIVGLKTSSLHILSLKAPNKILYGICRINRTCSLIPDKICCLCAHIYAQLVQNKNVTPMAS